MMGLIFFCSYSVLRTGNRSAGKIAIAAKPTDHKNTTLYAFDIVCILDELLIKKINLG